MATGCCRSCARIPPGRIPIARSTRATTGTGKSSPTSFLSELKDRPDLIEKCVPTYPPYGKRILLDNGWFKTLTKPNVELVTDAIDRFTRDGILTVDGKERPFDVIVVATGFKVTEMAARLDITGRGGRNLRDKWADDNPTAYLGLTVPDFPNFFCMLGPNSGPAHGGSVIFQSRMPEPLHLGLPGRDDRARHCRDRCSPGRARRLCPQGRCRARSDDLDPSGHDDLLPQQERPGVFRDAVALRRLLGHDP